MITMTRKLPRPKSVMVVVVVVVVAAAVAASQAAAQEIPPLGGEAQPAAASVAADGAAATRGFAGAAWQRLRGGSKLAPTRRARGSRPPSAQAGGGITTRDVFCSVGYWTPKMLTPPAAVAAALEAAAPAHKHKHHSGGGGGNHNNDHDDNNDPQAVVAGIVEAKVDGASATGAPAYQAWQLSLVERFLRDFGQYGFKVKGLRPDPLNPGEVCAVGRLEGVFVDASVYEGFVPWRLPLQLDRAAPGSGCELLVGFGGASPQQPACVVQFEGALTAFEATFGTLGGYVRGGAGGEVDFRWTCQVNPTPVNVTGSGCP